MELLFKLVLWLHLLGLAIGGAATFGIPAVLALAMKADPPHKPVFGQAIQRLSVVARGALLLLILTGVALVAWKHGGVAGLNLWFWLKMLLVGGLVGLIVFNTFNARRIRAGDAAAAARAPTLSKIGMALLAGIVLTAVLAFS